MVASYCFNANLWEKKSGTLDVLKVAKSNKIEMRETELFFKNSLWILSE